MTWPPIDHPSLHQPHARALRDCMSRISEATWCAGWLGGLEFILWRALDWEGEDHRFTIGDMKDLSKLQRLAAGWVIWDEKIDTSIYWGYRFMPTAEWLKILEAKK